MNLSFSATALFVALAAPAATAFAPTTTGLSSTGFSSGSIVGQQQSTTTQLFESTAVKAATSEEEDVVAETPSTTPLPMPVSYKEMVKQVSSAMKAATKLGKTHQIIRVCPPRDVSNTNLGVFSEGLMDVDSQNIVLVPPDESWQGGIMQLYYSVAPTMSDALRLYTENESGVPPRINEDRSVDESGVDGVSLLEAEATEGGEAIKCFVQPSQETVDDYVVATAQQPGLVVLINPQWRVTDDWFDNVSTNNDGFFGKVAGFLGGKGDTLRRLGELDFEPVYNLEGYVCRGWNIRMVKRFDTDYGVYVNTESGEPGEETYQQIGTKPERPTYQEVEKYLDDAGFQMRYTEGLV